MSLKKDKQKVLGEVFDQARIESFLAYQPPEGVSRDFHLLEKAYRGMNIDSFISFLELFKQTGYDLNAVNPEGSTLLQIVQQHHNGSDYSRALMDAGAGD
jgi:hypothetical protein